MKLLTIVGVSNSGKTTVTEELIKELKNRGHSVGSVKVVNCGSRCHLVVNGQCKCGPKDGFTIDKSGAKNSGRHRLAGSQQVTTWAESETAIMHQRELSLKELTDLYDYDYMIVEGDYRHHLPRIVTASTVDSAQERINELTFAVCGRVRELAEEIDGLPVFNPLTQISALADLVEQRLYPVLPELDELGCGLCGSSCKELAVRLLKGTASPEDCKLMNQQAMVRYNQEQVLLSDAQQRKLMKALNRVLEEHGLLPSNRAVEINLTMDGAQA